MFEIEFNFFGGLRRHKKTRLKFAAPVTVESVRQKLQIELKDDLILDSALADDDSVLTLDAVIQNGCVLSVLPPVCGG